LPTIGTVVASGAHRFLPCALCEPAAGGCVEAGAQFLLAARRGRDGAHACKQSGGAGGQNGASCAFARRTGVDAGATGVEACATGVEAAATVVEAAATGVDAAATVVEAQRPGVDAEATGGVVGQENVRRALRFLAQRMGVWWKLA